MNNKRDYARLRGLITAHVQAQIQFNERGGGDPADIPRIELWTEQAKTKLYKHIREMEARECGVPLL